MRSATPGLRMLPWLGILAGCGDRVEPLYDFTRLDVPGAASTVASGINASGQVVGWYHDTEGDGVHGFIFRDSGFTRLDYPGAVLTQLHGIGQDGAIVGTYRMAGESDKSFHGFLLKTSGEFVEVSVPGHLNTVAQRILPDGTILGCYHDDDWTTTMRGVTFSREGPVNMDLPATMTNGSTPDGRTVVGLVMDSKRAFIVDRGVLSLFDAPGSVLTEAWDINPSGTIVGLYEDSASATHGYLRQGEKFTILDVPGAVSTMIFGINAAGDLAGALDDSTGATHGFVARRARNPRG